MSATPDRGLIAEVPYAWGDGVGMLKDELEAALSHRGERGATAFLKLHPEIVVWGFCRTGGHSKYVLNEFPLGASHRADFVIPFSYSGAWTVNFVELEPVDDSVITKSGRPSARLNSAISQVNDWWEFIQRNRALVQRDLSDWCMKRDLLRWHADDHRPCNYTSDYLHDPETHVSFAFHIIIGRRARVTRDQRRKMNQLRGSGRIDVGTYDRFVDIAENYDRSHANPQASVRLTETREES